MFQNIKVDVIYYKTGTDFEMEFNLSGCCRMRLLTYKAADRKILVSQLARAVSRSRIIIMAGSLFGEDGIIKTSASAIGKKITIVDNKKYGIETENEIEIIENAIPLVNKEGIFGGCIIEQGPQTLILLSENKDIRKSIMHDLIHPYIKELCAAELTGQNTETISDEAEEIDDQLVEETDPQIVEEEIDGDELVLVPEGDYDLDQEDINLANEIVMDDDGSYLEDALKSSEEGMQDIMEGSEELLIEPEFFDEKSVGAEALEYAYMDSYIDGNDFVDGAETVQPRFMGWGINLPITIVSVILLLVCAVLCYTMFMVPFKDGVSTSEYLKDIINTLFG